MYQASIKNFKSYSNFASIKEFNNNIEQWMIDIKHEFTKKELVCLKRLIRYASKVFGVSNVSINKLLTSIEQKDNVKVSEATFQRMKRKAIKLGLLESHFTKRKNESQSSNLWVFNAYLSKNDTPIDRQKSTEYTTDQQCKKEDMTPHKTNKNIKTNNLLNNTYSKPYRSIRQAIQTFMGKDSNNLVNRLYGVYLGQTKHLRLTKYYSGDGQGELIEIAIKAINHTFQATKKKKIRNVAGYFNGILSNGLDELMYMDMCGLD